MAWIPKDKEVEALVSADVTRRYEYFIHRVCDTQKLWGLYDNGWASLGDGTESLFPLWPHAVYAELFKTGEWRTYVPQEIDLDNFLEDWIPDMREEGVGVAIFPVPSGSSVVVGLDDLEANLRHELSESYDEEG